MRTGPEEDNIVVKTIIKEFRATVDCAQIHIEDFFIYENDGDGYVKEVSNDLQYMHSLLNDLENQVS